MTLRLLAGLAFSAAVALFSAAPAAAQFSIIVQQNGQATSVASGGTITLNAPAVGQTATATVTVTFVGTGTVVFPQAPTVLGSTSFTTTATSATLAPFQSTTFNISYTAATSMQATAQFLWPFTQTTTSGSTTSTSSGAIAFSLVGTAPNLVVGQVPSTGGFTPVASGGTFTIPNTVVGSTAMITIGISNPGSGPATVTSITATGAGFQLEGVPLLPITIAAGNQLNVVLAFTPTAAGPVTGSLAITSGSGTYTAVISATAVTSLLSYQITENGQTSAIAPNQTIPFPATNVGSTSTVTILFQNTAASPVTLNGAAVSGTGFSISDEPFFPVVLEPGQSNSITITYAPLQPGPSTGRLQIGSDSFTLSGTALGPLLQFSYQVGSSGVITANAGSAVSFPPTAFGQTTFAQFTITNTGTTAAAVTSIGIPGNTGVFQVANLPALPLQLAPNASASFTISFTPDTSGLATATLLINNVSFPLDGLSSQTVQTLPSYQFTGASGVQQAFTQPSIGLSLLAPYPITLAGTLTLEDAPNGFSADPAVQFSTGGRQVTFTIAANTLQAVFANGSTQIEFQTGTVASTLTFVPDFTVGTATGTDITPANPLILQITVPSSSPVLLSAGLSASTTTSFSIVITGYSATRSLNTLTFQFTAASGSSLSGTTTTINVSGAAAAWFSSTASQALGGEFTVTVPFSLTNGNSTTTVNLLQSISSVSVTAANSVGTSNTIQVGIP